MVRCIDEDKILQLIKDRKRLADLNTIIKEDVIDNELMIDMLYENKILPIINNISCIKIYNYSNAQEYVMQGYFVYEDKAGNKITAINNLKLLFDEKNNFSSIALIKKYYFYKSLEQNFAHLNSIKAKYALEFKAGPITAKNINYANKVIIFFVVFLVILIYLPVLFHIANNISYFVQNVLKSLLFVKAIRDYKPLEVKQARINIEELPIYTILVPLYKELSKLRSIIKNISLINYPDSKLDVKIIIEDDDYLMIKEMALYNLPAYFHVILVPQSFPRTKPKALNYALEYSRGEYVVVYDAEDKPEPDQLLKALAMFKSLAPDFICLQAKLNFYNKNENVLTKMFNLEYSLWFEYILKGLSLLKLPTPLGGTSNHFKADILRKLGGWDAHNVTEDAEIGLRIYSQNYKVAILDSYTLEEAPNSLGNWLNQRSRWIKGFLQTFFVFIAQKDKYKKLTLLQMVTIYIFIGLSTYNFWCLPFIIFSIIINKNSIIDYVWLVNSIFSLLYLYGTVIYILKNSLKFGKIKFQDLIALVLWAGYFILHTIASYKAVFEIIFCPFKWNKTKHGVSLEDFEE